MIYDENERHGGLSAEDRIPFQEQGRRAFADGQPVENCPYRDRNYTFAYWWADGWWQAHYAASETT